MSLWPGCQSVDDRYDFQQILQHLELSQVQKQIIQSRYIAVVEHVRKRVRMFARMFYTGHTTITVGSLFVPALLSIQNSNYTTAPNAFSSQIYWATFIMSLLVTICNGMLALFKIDKKYYFLNTTLERLRTEGWQYMGLTGRYSGHLLDGIAPTHQNQFVFFTHQIEKIKMKQELRTMSEKKQLDPNELMENGLTRKQNEEQQKAHENFSGAVSIVVVIISLYCMYQAFVGLNSI